MGDRSIACEVLYDKRGLILSVSKRYLHKPNPFETPPQVLQLFQTTNAGMPAELVKIMRHVHSAAVCDLFIEHGVKGVVCFQPAIELKDMRDRHQQAVPGFKVVGNIFGRTAIVAPVNPFTASVERSGAGMGKTIAVQHKPMRA